MSRRIARAALLLAALASGGLGCGRPAAPEEIPERLAALGRPNLVLILVDTLRADFTTPYGSSEDTSPELLAWARRGVLFERARAQSSWTKISVASLLTSLWPRSHEIRDATDGLADAAHTLAEALREAGYATYGVQTNGWLDQSFGFHQGFDRYMFPHGAGDPRLGRPSLWPHADRVVLEARRLLDAHDAGRPFFLYLHFMDVHEYAAPPPFKTFGADETGAYRAAIRWTDDAVRRVREALAEAGQLDRTVIALGSDHGETFGEHGVHGHARNVLTPVVWVPLVLRFPFRVEPAVRIATQVRNLDIAPTLLDLAGVPIPESFEGRSLVPLLTGRRPEPDRESYAGLGMPLFPDASVQAALTDGGWTYARNAPAAGGGRRGRRRAALPAGGARRGAALRSQRGPGREGRSRGPGARAARAAARAARRAPGRGAGGRGRARRADRPRHRRAPAGDGLPAVGPVTNAASRRQGAWRSRGGPAIQLT